MLTAVPLKAIIGMPLVGSRTILFHGIEVMSNHSPTAIVHDLLPQQLRGNYCRKLASL